MSHVSVLAGLVTRTWAATTPEGVKQITLTHHTVTGQSLLPRRVRKSQRTSTWNCCWGVGCGRCVASVFTWRDTGTQARVSSQSILGKYQARRAPTRRWAGPVPSRLRSVFHCGRVGLPWFPSNFRVATPLASSFFCRLCWFSGELPVKSGVWLATLRRSGA
jgi:hypothetical protein